MFALFVLGNLEHYFPVSGCCMWNTENWLEILWLFGRIAWLDSGYMFCISDWRFSTKYAHFLRRSGLEF